MAIEIWQTGRTATSVTYKVSGLMPTDTAEKYIYIPWQQQWRTLEYARQNTLIAGFSEIGEIGNIRRITINLNPDSVEDPDAPDINGFKVWQVYVVGYDVNGRLVGASGILNTIVAFQYDGEQLKYSGDPIDITVNDFKRLNWFAHYIYYWIGGVNNSWSFYTDAIYADDFKNIAQKIRNTSAQFNYVQLPDKASIESKLNNILNNVASGEPFKADYFNDIWDAINSFNLKV